MEEGWNLDHEDLRGLSPREFGQVRPDCHGTAVLGVICANHENELGVMGMVPQARIGVAPLKVNGDLPNPEDLLQRVASWLRRDSGDVLLVEVGAVRPGQNPGNCGGYLPMEAWAHGRAALNFIHARGAYAVEVAANGGFDLDTVPGMPRSGLAMVVGAGHPQTGVVLGCSNRGTRVDLQGWGGRVVTAGAAECDGHRNLQFCEDTNRCYMRSFRGTSSAAAIVAGCVACISGVVKANGVTPLSAQKMKEILIATGSFPDRAHNGGIGPLPNVRNALLTLEQEIQASTPGFRFH
ncbi:MAG TPA: S8 family serine peptidase [Thermoanaerobaculia bacterium]|nr:S8 family serine peptidase [Thermoanaerobaculia bacterium]